MPEKLNKLKKSQKKEAPVKKLKASALKELWKKVPIHQWYSIISSTNRSGQWTLQGRSIKGCCPYHNDDTPSFYLNFDKCIGKCFGSCGKVVTDLISFYAKISNQSYIAALTDLESRINISSIIGDVSNEIAEYSIQQEMKKYAAISMQKIIDEYVRDRPSYLEYIKPAIIYLVQGRKLPLNILSALPVGIYGKPEHLKKYIPGEYHDCFDQYFKEIEYYGSIVFHYNNLPGSISKFKIRKLVYNADNICQEYSITDEVPLDIARGLAEHSFILVNDPFIKELGVFGLHHYNRMLAGKETDAYITEGEFDAMAVMAAQLADARTDYMMFAFGGNGNNGLSFLREFGLRTLWVVQDSPSKNGNSVAKQLLSKPENFVGDGINSALSYKIFNWTPELRGADLDELVNFMGYTQVTHYLFTNRANMFLNTYSWVTMQCDLEIEEIKKNTTHILNSESDTILKENTKEEIKSHVVSIIRDWFHCIHDEVDKLSYIHKYSVSENIDLASLSDINNSLYNLETIEGVINRITDAFKEHFELVYYESSETNTRFTLWSKQNKEFISLPTSEIQRISIFSKCVKRDVTSWVIDLLKGSSFLEDYSDESNNKKKISAVRKFQRMQSEVASILSSTYNNMISKVKSISDLMVVGQGIHYADLGKSGRNYVYFVNGELVFRGKYTNDIAIPVEWEVLTLPIDNSLLFSLDRKKRWSFVENCTDLYHASKIDIKELFNNILNILDAWKFEDHELIRIYLAAWILSLPIQRAINQVTITFITGASTSGKTSFLRGLLGGTLNSTTFEVPSIIEGSWFASDASPAGIYQEMDNSALALCLDEAEARQNTDHSARVSAFQELAYSIPFGGAKMARGGATSGSRITYTLFMPVIMAAINMASNPTFLSRVIPIYTVKDLNRKNIGTYIYEKFANTEIDTIRQNITICMLDKLPKLCAKIPELRKFLAKQKTSVKISDRYITILLPAMVVLDYLGYDVADIFVRMVDKNKNLIDNLNFQDFHSDLINAVLYTEGVKVVYADNSNATVSAKDCILSGDIVALNNSHIGVNILPEKGWIVIFWRDVKYSLLRFSEFRYLDESALRESVSKNKYLINNISEQDHKYIISILGRTDIKNQTQYSVISAHYLLDDESLQRLVDNTPTTTTTTTTKASEENISSNVLEQEIKAVGKDFMI